MTLKEAVDRFFGHPSADAIRHGLHAMTIQTAVAILNERKHQGYVGWYVSAHGYICGPEDTSLTKFETIAVAEKYQRE